MNYKILIHKNGFGGIESYLSSFVEYLNETKDNAITYIHKDLNLDNQLSKFKKGGYFNFIIDCFTIDKTTIIFSNTMPLIISLFIPHKKKISLFHGIPKRYFLLYYLLSKLGNKFFFVNSIYTQKIFMSYFGVKLEILYPLIRPNILEIASKFNTLSNNSINKNIGYLGRISKEKNILSLITLHNNILPKYPEVKLILCGKCSKEFKDEILKCSTNINNIIFLDYTENLYHYFRLISINFLITDFSETYGIVTIESLLFGKKVVIPRYLFEDFSEFSSVVPWQVECLETAEMSIIYFENILNLEFDNSDIDKILLRQKKTIKQLLND